MNRLFKYFLSTNMVVGFMAHMQSLPARTLQRCGTILLLSIFLVRSGEAQKINFGAYTTSQGLSLVVGNSLNFGNIITNSPVVNIGLFDNCAYVQIIGDATRDITIIIPSSAPLSYGSDHIPFTCQFAYSNLGSPDVNTAKLSAVQISPGVTVITVPMLQRTGGAPAPPPTPAHGGYTAPSTSAYLFLYGTFGPVGSVASGAYSGTVNVYVDYTTY